MFSGLPDPAPDPLVRGLDPDPDPLVRGMDPAPDPSMILTFLLLLYDFLSLRNDMNLALKSNKQKKL
jgi:hypothetical protein